MKIAFITPRTKERRAEFQYLPLGIAYIASVLLNEDHEVKIFDSRIENYSEEEFKEKLHDFNPTLIGATSTTYQIFESVKMLKEAKEACPNAFSFIGGAHVSALPAQTLSTFSWIDFGVVGEGEITTKELASALSEKKPSFGSIKGLAFRKNKNIFLNEKRELINDLDSIPFPARNLFNLKKYDNAGLEVKKKPMTSIISSRGCPGQCIFCSKAVFGASFRARSPENIILELEELIEGKYHYKEIHVMDDNFTLNIDRAEKICNKIIEKDWNVKFALPNGIRVDRVSKELLEKMYDAGFYCLFFGVESGDDKVLKKIGKNISLKQVKNAIKMAKKIGFYTGIFLVAGLPGSSLKSEEKSLKLALDLDVDQASLSVITPYPGSRLYNLLSAQGLIKEDWNTYRHDFSSQQLLYDSALSKEEIQKFFNDFVKKFYLRPSYPFKLIYRHKYFGCKKLYVMLRSLLNRKYSL